MSEQERVIGIDYEPGVTPDSQPYYSDDQSRNNALFGIFGMGEGWHNTHHAFPTSARHGLRWWQFDLSYWVIRGLELIGLAWNVKLPSRAAIARGIRY